MAENLRSQAGDLGRIGAHRESLAEHTGPQGGHGRQASSHGLGGCLGLPGRDSRGKKRNSRDVMGILGIIAREEILTQFLPPQFSGEKWRLEGPGRRESQFPGPRRRLSKRSSRRPEFARGAFWPSNALEASKSSQKLLIRFRWAFGRWTITRSQRSEPTEGRVLRPR